MAIVKLTAAGRRSLEQIIEQPKDAKQYRRAQAILWLADGERPTEVARRLRVNRDTIYEWAKRYEERKPAIIAERLKDATRSGRPRTERDIIEEMLPELLDKEPREYGYRASNWTKALLCLYFREHQSINVSEATMQRSLHSAGYRWKRPRFVLSRRPKYWRQAKGGLNEDSKGESVQLS